MTTLRSTVMSAFGDVGDCPDSGAIFGKLPVIQVGKPACERRLLLCEGQSPGWGQMVEWRTLDQYENKRCSRKLLFLDCGFACGSHFLALDR
jgi:hypothetical protein